MITRTLFETKVTDVENSQIGRNIEKMFVNVLYLILKVNQYSTVGIIITRTIFITADPINVKNVKECEKRENAQLIVLKNARLFVLRRDIFIVLQRCFSTLGVHPVHACMQL